jgi:hypothetical protein
MNSSISMQKSVAQKTAIPTKGKPPKKAVTPLQAGIVIGSVLLLVGLGYLIYIKTRAPELPPVNADTVTLAKFLSDEKYGELDFQQQFKFMKVMEDRDDKKEIRKAFLDGQLNEEEYRQAKLEAWVAQQINRTDKFLEAAPGRDRIAYITERVKKDEDDDDKDDKDKDKDKDDGNKGAGDKGGDGDKAPKAELPKVDPSLKKARLEQLPADVRERYRQYKEAYDEEQDRRDLEKKAKKAQKAATQPGGTPAAAGA